MNLRPASPSAGGRVLALLLLAASVTLHAEVSLPRVFSDGLVLQRDMPVPVWGRAAPGEVVHVRFADQDVAATAGADGRWMSRLAPLTASEDSRTFTVQGRDNTITLADVLVGEVWLAGGQSNMDYALDYTPPDNPSKAMHAVRFDPALAEELRTHTWPHLRLFHVEKQVAPDDVVCPEGWQPAAGVPRARFSAVGYVFGRDLHQALKVPVGIIQSTWGGTRIEPWTPTSAYESAPAFAADVAADAAHAGGGGLLHVDGAETGRLYDRLIAPLVPYAVRGVLWYQGESNLIECNDGPRYADKFAVLVRGWRAAWGRDELPFYAVQIAPYAYTSRKDKLKHDPYELPRLWAAQEHAAEFLPHTGLVPNDDPVADIHQIHPGGKGTVARRLLALALTRDYGREGLVHEGPRYGSAAVGVGLMAAGGGEPAVVVRWAGDARGLKSRDSAPLTDFELEGADGVWRVAEAAVQGETVVVTARSAAEPRGIRFAWREDAQPNLVNGGGWPAYPFLVEDLPKAASQ